jgi:hypothetical protein
MAQHAGFVSVANSRFYANSSSTSTYELGRVAMLRDVSLDEFGAICQGEGLWKKRLSHQARQGAQTVLGNNTYDQLRAVWLRENR